MFSEPYYHIEVRTPGSRTIGQYTLHGGDFWDATVSIAEMYLKRGASIDIYTGRYLKDKAVWKFDYKGTLMRVPGGYYFGTADGKHGRIWSTLLELGNPRAATSVGKTRRR